MAGQISLGQAAKVVIDEAFNDVIEYNSERGRFDHVDTLKKFQRQADDICDEFLKDLW